jgi:hypothetical protein
MNEIELLQRLAELRPGEMALIEREREIWALGITLAELGATREQMQAVARAYVAGEKDTRR